MPYLKQPNTKKKLSFKSGFDQIQLKDVKNFYKDIQNILGISSRRVINSRLKKGGEFSPVEYEALIKLFKKYKVTENVYKELEIIHTQLIKHEPIKQKRT